MTDMQCLANRILHFAGDCFFGKSCLLDEGEKCENIQEDLDAALKQFGISYSFYEFCADLPEIKSLLDEDLDAAYNGDPAATSKEEIVEAYPGFYAVVVHRVAHLFYKKKAFLLARLMSEIAHSKTGIDIHPGASIGHRFFVDHGTGVVIGETAEIGNDVRIYQGVTLGAKSLDHADSLRGKKRHPTIKDNVVIYAGASILGGDTIIGNNVTIGSNVFITFSIEDGKTVRFENKNYSILDK